MPKHYFDLELATENAYFQMVLCCKYVLNFPPKASDIAALLSTLYVWHTELSVGNSSLVGFHICLWV